MKRRVGGFVAALFAFLLYQPETQAGSYTFASESNGVDLITHPTGYTGSGGTITVDVCIRPTSANASAMEIPVQNAIDTWNSLVPTTGNLNASGVGGSSFDFESVALHEIGHCIGVAHPNLASESGLLGVSRDATRSTDGANNSFGVNDGADNVFGSADDVRGDDVSLHWFEKTTNDPFQIATTVDQSTYSREVADLPPGDLFPANGSRGVANLLLGSPDTEAVMQQGTFSGETQRLLSHDDVATIRLAQAGLDGVAGTSDDYTTTLQYVGLVASCDIVVQFDNAETSFASCATSGSFIGGSGHVEITAANVYFNNGNNWFFNPVGQGACGDATVDVGEDCDDGNTLPGDCCSATCQFESSGASCQDADFCNGEETCDGLGACQPGPPPVIDDGVVCTVDTCDEVGDVVVHTPDDLLCTDGLFCNGAETCDGLLGCQAGTPPVIDDGVSCTVDTCDEVGDVAVHTPDDLLCTDGLFCNGEETCDGLLDCQAGAPPVINDGVSCTADNCDEVNDVVVNTPLSTACDDGDPCTADSCDAILGCSNEPIPVCGSAVPSGGSAFAPALAGLLAVITYLGLAWERRSRRSR